VNTISVQVVGLVTGMATAGEEVGSAVPILYITLLNGLAPNVTVVLAEHQAA